MAVNTFRIVHKGKVLAEENLEIVKYETDGHYWTVYAVALLIGINNELAEKLGQLSEKPDTVIADIDKYEKSKQNYTWAFPEEQKNTHALLGSKAKVEVVVSFAKTMLLLASSDDQLSSALHYFGDAFAHQRMSEDGYYGDCNHSKGVKAYLFEKITGGTAEHAFGVEPDGTDTGLRPDLIYNRVPLYNRYVKSLAEVLAKKYFDDYNCSIDMSFFNKLTSYAEINKVSLIGIINYEVAVLRNDTKFFVPRSSGFVGDDNFQNYINNTENYLLCHKVNYKLYDNKNGVIFYLIK